MRSKKPRFAVVPAAGETRRHAIIATLENSVCSALDISRAVGIPEKEVALHLEHIARTIRGRGGRLVVTPALCRSCGFAFRKRDRYTKPGRCPVCKKGPIEPPLFAIAGEGP